MLVLPCRPDRSERTACKLHGRMSQWATTASSRSSPSLAPTARAARNGGRVYRDGAATRIPVLRSVRSESASRVKATRTRRVAGAAQGVHRRARGLEIPRRPSKSWRGRGRSSSALKTVPEHALCARRPGNACAMQFEMTRADAEPDARRSPRRSARTGSLPSRSAVR